MSRRKRLDPSRVWLDREVLAFARGFSTGSIILDAGSGDQRYKDHFAHCTYEAADFEMVGKTYPAGTYTCDLANIPVEDARFDGILFTQVMEHLPEPLVVLQELKRVLKPGGVIFYSGPLYYEEHQQPYDFYRYTQFALRHMFDKVSLEIEDLHWLEGFLATAAHQLRRMVKHFPKFASAYGPGARGLALYASVRAFRKVAERLAHHLAHADARQKYTETGYPMNYVVIARKAK
jgi:SAM-dependent methyltransferase